jgi:alkylhydroperoxidase family enzyme
MIPRLSAEDLPADVARTLRPRIERLGYLGEFFRCAAHQPAALISFMTFTEDLKRALPDSLTEVVALTVATELDNAYERHQHERLCLKLEFGEAWVRAVEALDPASGSALTTEERAAQVLTLAVVRRSGRQTAAELEALVQLIGHEQAIAVLMLIGRYVTHALMVNALDLAPPVPSPFVAPGRVASGD